MADDGRGTYRRALAGGRGPALRGRLIAHRGWHRLEDEDGGETARRPLENTREAYQGAAELGLALAECDVWATADGEVVLSHDASLRSMAEDPGSALAAAAIAELRWEELRHVRLRGGAAPVLLRTVLGDLAGSGTRLVVELKSSGPAEPLAALLNAEGGLKSSLAYVMSFSLAAVERFAGALEERDVRVLWLLDNPVTPYEEHVKNEGETTFDYGNETLAMMLARLGLADRIGRLRCGLHVQYRPCLTPSHVHAWRAELASIWGAVAPEGDRAGGEEAFVGLWTDGGGRGFDRAATLAEWLPAASAINTDLPPAFLEGL